MAEVLANYAGNAQAWLSTTETGQLTTRVAALGLAFFFLDCFIVYGPLKTVIPRIFGLDPAAQQKNARRLTSQVAARIVGCIFLATMFPYAFKVITNDAFKTDKLHYYNEDSIRCLVITAGYFLYDIIICSLRFGENGLAFFVHATLCSFAYWYAATSHMIHYYGCGFLLWELSTPLLYVRWVLLKAGKNGTKLMPLANAAFMMVFFGCRVIHGPALSYDFYKTTQLNLANPAPGSFSKEATYSYYTAMSILNGLNFYWFSQMVLIALGVVKSKQPKKDKKV